MKKKLLKASQTKKDTVSIPGIKSQQLPMIVVDEKKLLILYVLINNLNTKFKRERARSKNEETWKEVKAIGYERSRWRKLVSTQSSNEHYRSA